MVLASAVAGSLTIATAAVPAAASLNGKSFSQGSKRHLANKYKTHAPAFLPLNTGSVR